MGKCVWIFFSVRKQSVKAWPIDPPGLRSLRQEVARRDNWLVAAKLSLRRCFLVLRCRLLMKTRMKPAMKARMKQAMEEEMEGAMQEEDETAGRQVGGLKERKRKSERTDRKVSGK